MGAELGQYILQAHKSKKFWRFNGGLNLPNPPLGTPVLLTEFNMSGGAWAPLPLQQ